MNRSVLVSRLCEGFDVLVIGGGATGLGAALDAASRGYTTALVEAADFATATSSRSTKLVHGGVRYLQNGDVGLVREALRERARLLHNAPHLVHDLRFVLPTYRALDVPYYFAGLKAYDLLASGSGFGSSGYIGPSETLRRMPALRSHGLRGAIAYHDGQFDDSRLALALARSAIDRGAAICNYVRCEGLLYEHDRVAGATVRDLETGGTIEVRARTVLNATGIFVDDLRAQDEPAAPPLLEHSRGTHVVFSRDRFPGTDALIVPKTDDGRVLFAIPWHDHVVVGTTDVEITDVELEPAPPRDEIDYIVEHFNRYLESPVRREDALASFAGIRPLVNRRNVGTAKLSREHIVETSARGLVTITGGKWTTYRKMGEDAVDALARASSLRAAPTGTIALRLRGAFDGPPGEIVARYAAYGTDA
ncbi:MAG: glycerol-3-phosphate dehydrogenase/oxidase, partial [Candidatus Eremiobacteraeota bacterium]|nr:glycerol-3-phosphate dehydrogenase/oxidase [Candidatus Eremiobacteraeota bacterium]